MKVKFIGAFFVLLRTFLTKRTYESVTNSLLILIFCPILRSVLSAVLPRPAPASRRSSGGGARGR